MSIFKTLFKDTFIYGLAMVLPKLVNLLFNGMYTAHLENSGYSEITSFYVYAGFINVILTYGMETSFFRFYTKAEEKKKVYTTALISLLTTLAVFLIFTILFRETLATWFKVSVPVFLMLIGLVAADILAVIPFAYLRAEGKALNYFGIKVFTLVVINGFLNLFFISWVGKYHIKLPDFLVFDQLETYVFIANFTANISMLFLVAPSYFKYPWKFDTQIFKQMRRYGAPILIAGIAFLIIENIDKLILRDLLGKALMGAYSACYKFGIFLMLFIQAFRMGIEPFFFNQSNKSNAKESYALVLKFFAIFASLGILVVLSFQGFLIQLIIKQESYLIALKIVPVILLANWCLGVYQSLSVWYKVTDNTKYGMYFTVWGALITLLINYLFIPKIGFMAAAYATIIAYGSMMALSYFIGKKHYPIPYPVFNIFSYLAIALVLCSFTWWWFPQNYLLKFVAILVYLAFVIGAEKNDIKQLFNKA